MVRLPVAMIVALSWLALASGSRSAAGPDKTKEETRDARETATAFLEAALAGRVQEAAAMAQPGQISERKIREELTNIVNAQKAKFVSAHASEKGGRALIITEAVPLAKPQRGRNKLQLAITLKKIDKRWLVRDIDYESEETAKEELRRFLTKYPDAKAVPAEGKKK